jgi:hypothetical protein
VVIQRVAAAFEPPLRDLVEVRNQARVHLWFEKKFGADEPYPPLEDSAAALKRFVATAFCVGVRLESGRQLERLGAVRPGGPVRHAPAAQSAADQGRGRLGAHDRLGQGAVAGDHGRGSDGGSCPPPSRGRACRGRLRGRFTAVKALPPPAWAIPKRG